MIEAESDNKCEFSFMAGTLEVRNCLWGHQNGIDVPRGMS